MGVKGIGNPQKEMRNFTMKTFAEQVKVKVFETNEKGEMKQNVRNAFKADVMNALKNALVAMDLDVLQTADGLAVKFENDVEGAVTVIFDGTVKSFQFDAETANAEFLQNVADKAEKAEKALVEKEKKIALQNALKEKKEKAKA
jgi:hypothetical protein